jgi:lysophospholipase L1-like esterase
MPAPLVGLVDALLKPGSPEQLDASAFNLPEVKEYRRLMDQRAENDWPQLCNYHAANAELKTPPRVVFMGDSITEYWLRGDPQLFTDGVIDRGISGQTSQQMLLRFYDDVIALQPATVHIMAGTNDVAGNTGPTSQEMFEHNIMAMVELARAHHIRVVIGSIPPAAEFFWQPSIRPSATIIALNAWLRNYCASLHIRYVDYYSALVDDHGALKSAFSNDGVHPNKDGYAVMRPLALKAMVPSPVAASAPGG